MDTSDPNRPLSPFYPTPTAQRDDPKEKKKSKSKIGVIRNRSVLNLSPKPPEVLSSRVVILSRSFKRAVMKWLGMSGLMLVVGEQQKAIDVYSFHLFQLCELCRFEKTLLYGKCYFKFLSNQRS
jgi:hypothetical protein